MRVFPDYCGFWLALCDQVDCRKALQLFDEKGWIFTDEKETDEFLRQNGWNKIEYDDVCSDVCARIHFANLKENEE